MKTSTKNIQKFDKSQAVGFYRCTRLTNLDDYFKGGNPDRRLYNDDNAIFIKVFNVGEDEEGHKIGNVRFVESDTSNVKEVVGIDLDVIFQDMKVDVIINQIEIAKLVLLGL